MAKIMGIEKHNLQVDVFRNLIQNKELVSDLQKQLDGAEKRKENGFLDFSDVEILNWYLHKRKHLDEKKDRSARTIMEYGKELSLFVKHLLQYGNEIDLDIAYIIEGSLFKSLEKRHLRRYQEWLERESPYVKKKGKYSPATLDRKTTIIKSFFAYLHKVGYIQEPIHEGFYIAGVRKDDRPNRDLGADQVLYMMDSFKEQQHPIMFAIIHILTTTGIRNEEFCTLQVQSLKEDKILGGYTLEVIGKGNKARSIPLKAKVVNSIHMFRYARGLPSVEESKPTDPLFTTNRGNAYKPSYLSQYVTKEIAALYMEQKGEEVRLTPHYFRHAFAIISRLNKVDVYNIMRSLGHERLETTEIYLAKTFEKENHAIHKWKPELFGEYI
ncbi:tyrosine-type recombinase/integrase [Psychrobacillus sp. FSL H8-0510]|uniref:tyrosine-type recombinase/integrase n=1 Tax=Psychrobacillus sp. FSL H8-0510 TaxID=2921394 RepID=UPI0030F9A597